MSNKSPVFPMSDIQQHFSDYGFHPHFDYFQVLEEARKQKEHPRGRSTNSQHNFKLQKPIISSQEDSSKIIKKKHSNKKALGKKGWWKHALHFFKGKLTPHHNINSQDHHHAAGAGGVLPIPVYITESRSGCSTPYRMTSRSTSGSLSPAMRVGTKDNLPYISLRDFNNGQQQRISATSPMPIYLVT